MWRKQMNDFDLDQNIRDFITTGQDLFASGAVASHSGNLSVSDGSFIWITRTGTRLGRLTSGDIMMVGWEASDADDGASVELNVHRAMYHARAKYLAGEGSVLSQAAIVHTHGLHTVFQSLQNDSLTPLDSEGLYVLEQAVSVLTPSETIASAEVAVLMSQLVQNGEKIGVVRGHGPFAIAESLQKACRLVSCLEYSAQLLTLINRQQVSGG
jgi:L-fuculose-phosphate aldolase